MDSMGCSLATNRVNIYSTNILSISKNIKNYKVQESDINRHCRIYHMNPTQLKITEKRVRSFFNTSLSTEEIVNVINTMKDAYAIELATQYVKSFSIKPPVKPMGRIDCDLGYNIGMTYISSSDKNIIGVKECTCIRISFGFDKDDIFFMNAFPIPYLKFNELDNSQVFGLVFNKNKEVV